MDELQRVLAISLTGEERDRAVTEFRACLDRWQMAMPPAEAIVQDFLDDNYFADDRIPNGGNRRGSRTSGS